MRSLLCALLLAGAVAGCGLAEQLPDLYLLRRTGDGKTLMLLVNDGGMIRCNGGSARPLPDPLLIQARYLAQKLDDDVTSHVRLAPGGVRSVFSYSVRLQDGTLTFPDTAAGQRSEIAQFELWTVQAAESVCGIAGG